MNILCTGPPGSVKSTLVERRAKKPDFDNYDIRFIVTKVVDRMPPAKKPQELMVTFK